MIDVLITLVILGVALYLIGLIPMDETIRQVIRVVVILVLVVWMLGLLTGYAPAGLRWHR